jgi:phosphate starvation-inducible PhoH-like protein
MARAKSRVEKTEPQLKLERKEKIQEPLKLERSDFNPIKLTDSQLKFFKTCSNNFLTVCTGPAGTAKTFIACYSALDHLRKEELGYKKIILARPAVESGENLGFLPGSIKEKIEPYMDGYVGNMEKIIRNHDKLKQLIEKKVIDMQPIAFMRSRTFDDTILILDEAQNSDLRQIMLVVTRMGQNSKIIICGDITQWDLEKRKKDLLTFKEKISQGVNECSNFEFNREDIVRNPILIQLTDNYEKYKTENDLE